MNDITSEITVEEYVKKNNLKKLWLCPNLVSGGKIVNPPIFSGYECAHFSIPEEIKSKLVTRHFKEDNTDCLIWKNI